MDICQPMGIAPVHPINNCPQDTRPETQREAYVAENQGVQPVDEVHRVSLPMPSADVYDHAFVLAVLINIINPDKKNRTICRLASRNLKIISIRDMSIKSIDSSEVMYSIVTIPSSSLEGKFDEYVQKRVKVRASTPRK